ncbi:MAG: dethiobiotin synthase, partial [Bacteroidales bacterium]|nr:dethiobiotin synthase [Bacteroidales bacterium]
MNIFVTGTDTDVGKTVVSAWICRQVNARYWKPLQTGCAEDSDKQTVKTLSPQTELVSEIYRLKAPLSPYDAAQLEGLEIDINKILETVPDKSVIE